MTSQFKYVQNSRVCSISTANLLAYMSAGFVDKYGRRWLWFCRESDRFCCQSASNLL